MIELIGATVVYPYGARLFKATDLVFHSGEIVALLGRDGAGKTSFLKMIAGAVEMEGKVLIDGVETGKDHNATIMVFDDGSVFPLKTVAYNIGYPLRIRKVSKKERVMAVEKAAEIMNITACLPFRAATLSQDERTKMSLARLFVRDAKVLLIDEPTKALDKDGARRIFDHLAPLLKEKAKAGCMVIYSTSDIDQAMAISDRIIALHGGEIRQIDAYEKLVASPNDMHVAELVDDMYNTTTGVLSCENDILKLDLGDERVLDVSKLKGRIAKEYIGKEVYVGWHPKRIGDPIPAVTSEEKFLEKVVFVKRSKMGFCVITEYGINSLIDEPSSVVDIRPSFETLMLFERKDERSIMREGR